MALRPWILFLSFILTTLGQQTTPEATTTVSPPTRPTTTVRNLCLDPSPSLCPTGPYECSMHGVNNYSCVCAPGYYENSVRHCDKVSHSVKLEMHFTETPYSEVYNDPRSPPFQEVRELIMFPFTLIYGNRMVGMEFQNFSQGSLVAHLFLYLKPAENGSQFSDEFKFKEHLLKCSLKTDTPDCFGKLGKVFLPRNAWLLQDERCDHVLCPAETQCQTLDGEAEKIRCTCAAGYEGYGSILDQYSTIVELCKDIDECATIPGACLEGEHCVNTPGSFECTTPCKDIKCPGYGECLVGADGRHLCECSWIYAGSSCSFPWTLIFLILSMLLLLAALATGFLLWRTVTNDKKGRYNVFAISNAFSSTPSC